jgi:hypothetical protein
VCMLWRSEMLGKGKGVRDEAESHV